MYSYEDRLRAVQLYIELGKRIGLTIRQLGYLVGANYLGHPTCRHRSVIHEMVILIAINKFNIGYFNVFFVIQNTALKIL